MIDKIVAGSKIAIPQDRLVEFCRRWKITDRRLSRCGGSCLLSGGPRPSCGGSFNWSYQGLLPCLSHLSRRRKQAGEARRIPYPESGNGGSSRCGTYTRRGHDRPCCDLPGAKIPFTRLPWLVYKAGQLWPETFQLKEDDTWRRRARREI